MRFFSIENRYLPPLFITTILLVGQLSFGLLESFSRTLLAIGDAIVFDLALGRYVYGKFPNLASAYITGISVGILIRSPEYWPMRSPVRSRSHRSTSSAGMAAILWNPSNFAICAMLLLAPEFLSTLSVQWGNDILPMVIVWVLGALITWRVTAFHITLTYVAVVSGCSRCCAAPLPAMPFCRGRADHGSDVSVVHLLHDHRPENDGEATLGPVSGGCSCRRRRDVLRLAENHPCALLRTHNRGPHRHGHRNLARLPNARVSPEEAAAA